MFINSGSASDRQVSPISSVLSDQCTYRTGSENDTKAIHIVPEVKKPLQKAFNQFFSEMYAMFSGRKSAQHSRN